MRKILAVLAASIVMLTVPGFQTHARADGEVSFNLFYESLGPYGYWVNVPPYGYVWEPGQVGPGWMPYVDGYWAWTDDGWTWTSYEPWGWATYHYGSWAFVNEYGWVWVPGTVWAPAWVVWYSGPGYIGWAPRPPVYEGSIPPQHCIFVRSGQFLNPHINNVVLRPSMNFFIMRRARPITVVRTIRGHPFYRGPSVRFVERFTGRRVRRLHLIQYNTNPRAAGLQQVNRIKGRQYYVYRPVVVRRRGEAPVVIRRGPVRMQPAPVEPQPRPGVFERGNQRGPAVIRRGPVRMQPAPVEPQPRPGVFERGNGRGNGMFRGRQEHEDDNR